jgi:hypothetical protein
MNLDPEQLQNECGLYSLRADELPPGPERAVAMLGMMCCCAASWGRFRDVPPEWGWPRAVNLRIPEVVPRTPRAQNC